MTPIEKEIEESKVEETPVDSPKSEEEQQPAEEAVEVKEEKS